MEPVDVRAILAANGLRPKRSLGQNFVTDPNTLRKIVFLAELSATDRVLEIGPGVGSLTAFLLDAGCQVLAMEIDPSLVEVLNATLQSCAEQASKLVVEQGDATKVSWPAFFAEHGDPGVLWRVVANLPYNVAVQIVMGLLESAPMVDSILIMVQREVGERLASSVGDRNYGAVSAKVAYFAEAKVVGRVPSSVFHPRPKVTSVLVAIKRRPKAWDFGPGVTYGQVCKLIHAGFGQRRKMLRRSLFGLVSIEAFEAASISPEQRAEELDIEQWGRLTNCQVATH